MLFFEERVRRDVFERQTVLLQTIALFVRIDPIARSRQRKTTFSKSGDKDRTHSQTAHIGSFEHAQAVAIGRAEDLRLRGERTSHFLKKRREPRYSRVSRELNAFDRRDECTAQRFERIEVEHHLRELLLVGRLPRGLRNLIAEAETIQQSHELSAQCRRFSLTRNSVQQLGKSLDHE